MGFLLSYSKGALAAPLSTVLGLEDMYDLIEVISIDAHNDAILRRRNRDGE
jgi:hypothetical protein